MQNDEDLFVQIIDDSKKRVRVLKLLSNFFNHPTLINVLIRTKIIHNLFEQNKTLDTNKLDLFHIQFSDTLIVLLKKLKKNKEQKYLILSDEIYINNDFISKIDAQIGGENFVRQISSHSQIMSQKTQQLYDMFVTDDKKVFSWTAVTMFSTEFKSEFYREIAQEKYEELVCFERNTYQNKNAIIEKKLLGRMNILKFKVKFLCGLVCKNEVIEVYEFRDSNDFFIYVQNNNSFFFLNENDRKELNLAKNTSNKLGIVEELRDKNRLLNKKLETIKTELTSDVQTVIKQYLEKITDVDFLNDLQNVDEQTNILKAMLNIKIN